MLNDKEYGKDGVDIVDNGIDREMGDVGVATGANIYQSGTAHDHRDMGRLGRKQEMNVSI